MTVPVPSLRIVVTAVGRRVAAVLGMGAVVLAGAAVPGPDEVDRFEREIRPLLETHCRECHSHEARRVKGGLMVDSLGGLLQGGDSGAAVVPGRPDESPLVARMRSADPDLRMPPKGPGLASEEITRVSEWIARGAPWPGQDAETVKAGLRSRDAYTAEELDWWSFRPPARVEPPPAGPGDGGHAVDRFVRRRLREAGLAPAPEAGRAAWIRRVTFDLTGLPPTPDAVAAFMGDASPDAHERVVDRLLASPAYGERSARLWLDLVRYAESDGYRADEYRPNAWRYRDWVVSAFNEDLPYDRFVQAQIAGDELWPGDPGRARVATAFLRHGIYEYNNRDVRGQWETILDDLTDTAGDVFLGLGFQCAKCHDHKFDPIRQVDYFRLRSFFAPVLPRDDLPVATASEQWAHAGRLRAWEVATRELREELDELEAPYRAQAVESAREKYNDDVRSLLDIPLPERSPLEHQLAALAYRQVTYELDRISGRIKGDDKARRDDLLRRIGEHAALRPAPLPMAFTVTDVGPEAPPVHLPRDRRGKPVEPAWPGFLDDTVPEIVPPAGVPRSTGRRSALARWLTRAEHPLTARVMVNRVWQQHFGRGLAANPSDFGRLGTPPSHPELLDWLATWFVDHDWSLKQLHRLLVTSATYRQAALVDPARAAAGAAIDPDNRLLWHHPVRRLEAEQIRDALLAVTGELAPAVGGAAVDASQPRRTVYLRNVRNLRDPLLDVFDAPENFTSVSTRNVTTTPLQALLMVNSQYLEQRSRAMARRIAGLAAEPAGRVEAAYRLAFGRSPDSGERRRALEFLSRQAATIPAGNGAGLLSEPMPHRGGEAVVFRSHAQPFRLEVPGESETAAGEFTVEAFVLARSVAPDGAARTIVSCWSGNRAEAGWSLGLTGLGSSFRPRTLVLELSGRGELHYEAVFAGPTLELNQPYYVAASVRSADHGPEAVRFLIRNLANDCEPVTVVTARHGMTRPVTGTAPIVIGDRAGGGRGWDGLIDEVRVSAGFLDVTELLVAEGRPSGPAAWWRLDPGGDPWADASGRGRRIVPVTVIAPEHLEPDIQALADLSHVLLNANEFVYLD